MNLTVADDDLDQPLVLLEVLRRLPAQRYLDYAAQIDRVVSRKKPLFGRRIAKIMLPPGTVEARARLLAYQSIIRFDASNGEQLEAPAANVAEATHQLKEIYSFTLRFDVAAKLLDLYIERWPNAYNLSIPLPILRGHSGPKDGFRDQRQRAIQLARKRGVDTTFIVFCGLRHGFGVDLNVMHHCCLAEHPANVVYVRDFSENLYVTGIPSVGGRAETVLRLKRLVAALGTRKLVCIGNSGGVFGSLLYGALLDTNTVLAFGGPTSLDIGADAERQSFQRLAAMHAEGQVDWPNIRAIYEKRPEISVSFYYAERNEVDRRQAQNMAGLPNVELHPVDSADHIIIDLLTKTGELPKIFAAAAKSSN